MVDWIRPRQVYVEDDGSLMIDCETCGGDGKCVEFYALSPADELPYERLFTCETCRGEGRYEVPLEAVEDDRCEEEADALPLLDYLRRLNA
jgi:hypothetical protein